MYVCKCVCICVSMYMYMYLCPCAHVICMCECTYVCMNMCMCTMNTHMYMCISLADLTLCPGRSILGAIRTNTTDTALVGDAIRWTNLLFPIAWSIHWCTPHGGGAMDRGILSRHGIPNTSKIGVLMWRVPM